jgi:hypothetical protein
MRQLENQQNTQFLAILNDEFAHPFNLGSSLDD